MINKTLNIHLDPPDASTISAWLASRNRRDLLSVAHVVLLGVVASFAILGVLFHQYLSSLFWGSAVLSGIAFFGAEFRLNQFPADLPSVEALQSASSDELARLSAFLATEEVKVYLQKVARQQRPLTRMEYRMLIAAPDDLKRDALKQDQLAILARETGLPCHAEPIPAPPDARIDEHAGPCNF